MWCIVSTLGARGPTMDIHINNKSIVCTLPRMLQCSPKKKPLLILKSNVFNVLMWSLCPSGCPVPDNVKFHFWYKKLSCVVAAPQATSGYYSVSRSDTYSTAVSPHTLRSTQHTHISTTQEMNDLKRQAGNVALGGHHDITLDCHCSQKYHSRIGTEKHCHHYLPIWFEVKILLDKVWSDQSL